MTSRAWCWAEASEGLEVQAFPLRPSPSPGGSSQDKPPSPGSCAKACPCPSGSCAGSRPKAPCSSCADEEVAQKEVQSLAFVHPNTSLPLIRLLEESIAWMHQPIVSTHTCRPPSQAVLFFLSVALPLSYHPTKAKRMCAPPYLKLSSSLLPSTKSNQAPALNTEDPALKKMDRSPSLQGVVILGQENRPLTK